MGCSSDNVMVGVHVPKNAFIFFIFNYGVLIDSSASPSFFFKSQVFYLFAFVHTETCALKLSEVDKMSKK